ncbi:MAG TPA: DUF4157 domain-containing protein, partial [Fimbriimonadaceae bacterium]|nr:DUF4157 domain-containing protein [Fimbriimonadaceae bacterium]
MRATTVTLHHGGSGIEPHAINAPGGHDYIGDLPKFRALEAQQATAGVPAQPIWKRSMEASSFALARAAGSAGAAKIAGGYGSLDAGIRALPSVPGLPPNSIWGAADRGFRSAGRSMLDAGASLGASVDARFAAESGIPGPAGSAVYAAANAIGTPSGDAAAANGAAASVMRKATGLAPDEEEVGRTLGKLSSPGHPVSTEVAARLSPFVGFDASYARVHADPEAGAAANRLHAEAFATGRDIYFAPGNYEPSSPKGLSLLAHELTHVAQQSGTPLTGLQHSRPMGSASDRMEAEARTVASNVLMNFASPNAIHVEQFSRVYEAAEGIGSQDSLRLDRISETALKKAQALLGAASGQLELVEVTIEIDLGRMSDDEAASLWAEAIVAEVNRKPLQSRLAAPVPSMLQKAPATPPPGAPDAAAQPQKPNPTMMQAMRVLMTPDVDYIIDLLKNDKFPDEYILRLFVKWRDMDEQYFEETGYKGTAYLDAFCQMLFNHTWDQGGYFATRWTNGFDEIYYQMDSSSGVVLREILKESKNWAGGPTMEKPESVWSYVGKREAYAGLTMVKHLSTGLSGVFDAGSWLGQKMTGRSWDFKLGDWVGKRWDVMLDASADAMGIDPNEKTIGNFTLKNVSDFGGAVISGLTMAGALGPEAGAGADAKAAAAILGATQAGMAAEGLYDKVKALREHGGPNGGPMSWSDIMKEPTVWVDVVGVVASSVGAAGGFAQEGSQLAKTLTNLGHGATGVQLATLGTAIYLTKTSDMPDNQKATQIADLLGTFLVTGVAAVNGKYGKKFEDAWSKGVSQQAPPGAPAPAPTDSQPPQEPTKPADEEKTPDAVDLAGAGVAVAAGGGAGGPEGKTPAEIQKQQEIDAAYAQKEAQQAAERKAQEDEAYKQRKADRDVEQPERKASYEGEKAKPEDAYETPDGPSKDETAAAAA